MCRARLTLSIAATIIVALLLILVAGNAGQRPAAAVPHFWEDPAIRTIVIADRDVELEKNGDILLTDLLNGEVPAGARQATVLSDSNCEPDENGISHCLNHLQIGDRQVLVQHHHDMRVVPCLSPGETVNIIDSETYRSLSQS
jgi:hypothetical protein